MIVFPIAFQGQCSLQPLPRNSFSNSGIWSVRRTPVWLIALVVLAQYPLTLLFNLVVFHQGWIKALQLMTRGLLNATLVGYAILLPLVVGGLLFLLGRLRPRDVGLRARDLPAAIIWALALWAVVNLGEAVAQSGHFGFDAQWTRPLGLIGQWIAQIFGNALYEEIVYRGFLTVQLALLFERLGRGRALVLGVILAQAVFASIHIGLLLNMGLSWSAILGTMPELFLAGVALATVYLFTGNLLIAVGVHALVDAPMLIPKDASGLGDDFGYVYLMLALVATCLWRWRIPAVTNSARSEAS
jgi:membrane protease YdiL (CAAX protease family)